MRHADFFRGNVEYLIQLAECENVLFKNCCKVKINCQNANNTFLNDVFFFYFLLLSFPLLRFFQPPLHFYIFPLLRYCRLRPKLWLLYNSCILLYGVVTNSKSALHAVHAGERLDMDAYHIGCVDVRDVAQSLIVLYENPSARQRSG